MGEPGKDPSLEFYETILTNIRDAVYTLDAKGRITWVNDVAIEEFDGGYDRDDLIGAPVSKILPDEDIEQCAALIQELLEGSKRSARCEVTLLTADGERVPSELRLVLLPFEDGEFQGTVGVARNITERKRREQYLTVLNRLLRHNLRNELNVILGHADSLATDDALARHHRERVEVIREVARELIRLGEKAQTLEALLDREGDPRDRIEVVGRVARLCDRYDDEYSAVTIETSFPVEAYVRGGDILELAVDNLLENAIEHATEDEPTVEVEITRDESDGEVEIAIRDDGPGIPEHEFRVLERWEESPLEHGSGLGLWLVTWVASTLNGDVTFATRESGGTEARLRVPLQEAET